MARPLPPDKSTRARAQGGLMSAKIPGLMTLRPASRGVHHHLALLARGRGRHHAQDSHQPQARAAGAVPLSSARRGVGWTHKPRKGGGPPACKDKRMLFLSTCPARRGSTGALQPPSGGRHTAPHGRGSDLRTGARCAHTGPGHTAARRIAQQPA